MKAQTIVIGEYQISPAVSFCLYQLPSPLVTPPRSLNTRDHQDHYLNYFCLEDLFAIFDLHLIYQDLICSYQHYSAFFCRDEAGRSYIRTHVMADIAQKNNICVLADLCRLQDDELVTGGAIPLLKMTTFVRLFGKPAVMSLDFEARPLLGTEWFLQQNDSSSGNKVKLEPFSPTLPEFISPSNSPHSRIPRLSSDVLSNTSSSSRSLISQMAAQHQKEDNPTIKLPKPSSLLLKRLAPKHGHKKNLTILTPSYNDDDDVHINSIQSAPLRTTIPPFHHHHHSNKVNKISKKISPPSSVLTVKSDNPRRLAIPATASAASAPWPKTAAQARFPSPPIVPSQQPAWGQYLQQQHNKLKPTIKTATMPYFPRTPTTSANTFTSNTNNTNTITNNKSTSAATSKITNSLSQKQKFLQPFEFLYDHIEQTRTLKTTLDDQIRRSSSLMQTLQSSSTMVESLVRRQVRDIIDQKFETKLKACAERISHLEHRVPTKDIPISPSISPSPTRSKIASLSTTTTVKEPIQDLLSQLMDRIDQLESKLEKQ